MKIVLRSRWRRAVLARESWVFAEKAVESAWTALAWGYVRSTVLAERKGSITVSALLGTGLVTLGVALSGVAGLSDDLQAATRQATPPATTPPLLSPEDELTGPKVSAEQLRSLQVDCLDEKKSRSKATGGSGHSSRET